MQFCKIMFDSELAVIDKARRKMLLRIFPTQLPQLITCIYMDLAVSQLTDSIIKN